MKSSRISLMLTGGLGNQLFQLAALLYYSKNFQCNLEAGIGAPRRNLKGDPEVSSFLLPKNVLLSDSRRGSWLTSKSMGYIMRMAHTPRSYEVQIVRKAFKGVAKIISFLYFQTNRKILAIQDLGYSALKLKTDSKYLLLGYFQTYRYGQDPDVFQSMLDLKIENPSPDLLDYIDLAKKVRPTVIHIRLGDYTNESRFGIVPQEYYLEALTLLESRKLLGECWLFSDQPEIAVKYFEECHGLNLRVIPEVNRSSSETLELMRYGANYVIGNSSFSWWAAFLSHTEKKTVISPAPWFAAIKEPTDLMPISWIRLPIIHS
jgi:hypothetical protein